MVKQPIDLAKNCNHMHLSPYKGYTNVYFCNVCGSRFRTEPKLDKSIE